MGHGYLEIYVDFLSQPETPYLPQVSVVRALQRLLRIGGDYPATLTRAPVHWNIDAMSRPALLIAALLAVAAPAVVQAQSGQSAPMNVEIDQATRVPLRAAAGSVIVGNPQIADVTVVDSNTLYITGKGYGVTEVVAVDAIGRTVFQRQIVVTDGAGAGRVRMWRGAQSTEMACGSSCSPSVRGSSGPAGGGS